MGFKLKAFDFKNIIIKQTAVRTDLYKEKNESDEIKINNNKKNCSVRVDLGM